MKILTYLITSIRAHHLIRLAIICLDHENWRYSIYIFQQYTYIVTCIYVSIREITTLWIYFKWWYFICIFSNISYLHLFLYHPIRIDTLYVSFQIFHIYIYFSIIQSELILYMYLFKYFISTFISLSSNQNWKCSLRKKEETPPPHTVSEHFQAVWNTERLLHFISKHFVKKKRKSADQRINFISVQYSHCQNMKIWKCFDFFFTTWFHYQCRPYYKENIYLSKSIF